MAKKAFLVTVPEMSMVTYRVKADTAEEALELCKPRDVFGAAFSVVERAYDHTDWDEAEIKEEEK